MRIARSVLGIPAAIVVAVLIGAAPATAGGPTSALVVNPATGSAGALYTTDSDYAILMDALAPASITVDDPPALSSGPGTSAINVTWLAHDVHVWRVDRIRVDAGSYVWVQTTEAGSTGMDFSGADEWHVAADGDAVYDVLNRLGVLPREPGSAAKADAASKTDSVGTGSDDTSRDGAGELLQHASADVSGTPTGAGDSGGAGSWWWLLPGVAAGAVLGAFARPLATEALARRRAAGPRHELIDL